MDAKTKDMVLEAALKLCDSQGFIDEPIDKLEPMLPRLDRVVIKSAIFSLVADGFINVPSAPEGFNPYATALNVSVKDTPKKMSDKEKAFWLTVRIELFIEKSVGYLRKRKEEKWNSIKLFVWDVVKWLLPLLVGVLLGKKL